MTTEEYRTALHAILSMRVNSRITEPLITFLTELYQKDKPEPKKLKKIVLKMWCGPGGSFLWRDDELYGMKPALDSSGNQLTKEVYVEDT